MKQVDSGESSANDEHIEKLGLIVLCKAVRHNSIWGRAVSIVHIADIAFERHCGGVRCC
jgi:hypothetical protein